VLVSVGSTHFDNRSFRLDDEATLNVVEPGFAAVQTATFETDLGLSRRMSHAEWIDRPSRPHVATPQPALLCATVQTDGGGK